MTLGKPAEDRGFTMIELLVVIAIIGILMLIVVRAAQAVLIRSKNEAVRAEIMRYKNCLESYHTAFQEYPAETCPAGQGSLCLFVYCYTPQTQLTECEDPTKPETCRQKKVGPFARMDGIQPWELEDPKEKQEAAAKGASDCRQNPDKGCKIYDIFGNELIYRFPGKDHTSDGGPNNADESNPIPDVLSPGLDKQEGTSDDIHSW